MKKGTRNETAKARHTLIRGASKNGPVTANLLTKNYGMHPYDAKASLIALTHSYCKMNDGFDLPQTFENKDGYLTLIDNSRSNEYFTNLGLAIALEKHLLIAKKNIKKDILNKQ